MSDEKPVFEITDSNGRKLEIYKSGKVVNTGVDLNDRCMILNSVQNVFDEGFTAGMQYAQAQEDSEPDGPAWMPKTLGDYTEKHMANMLKISADVASFKGELPGIEPKKEPATP